MEDEQKSTQSVFELIKENIDPKYGLPVNFAIPDFQSYGHSRHEVMRVAHYHDGSVEWDDTEENAPPRMPEELLSLVAGACNGEKNEDAIISYLHDNIWYQNRLHGYMDPVLGQILGDSSIPRGELLSAAFRWATKSPDVELTRLGLAILSVLDLGDNPECREAMLTLGYCEEFTGYVLDAVRDWPDGNEIVFDLAQKTHGEGKVDAVERLEARTEEIKDWIIKYGCENSVYNAYLALTCARKGGLVTYLRRKKLDDEFFDGICVILDPLLKEDEIRLYKRNRTAVNLFVHHAGRRDLSLGNLHTLLNVYHSENMSKAWRCRKYPALRKKCASILRREKYREKIISALKNGRSDSWSVKRNAHIALRLAHFLKMDITALLFDLVEHDPEGYTGYAGINCLETLYADPEYAAKTTAVYEEWVEKSALPNGMEDAPTIFYVQSILSSENRITHMTLEHLLRQIGGTPLSGVKIVKAGLSSPVSRDRKSACGILWRWRNALGKNLSEFSPELWAHVKAIADIEINADLSARYQELL
jgi:hypothetical protein